MTKDQLERAAYLADRGIGYLKIKWILDLPHPAGTIRSKTKDYRGKELKLRQKGKRIVKIKK